MLGIRRHHWFEVVSCHWESWFWVVYFRICSYQTLFLLIPLENVTAVYGPQTRHIHSSISSWRDHSQYMLTRQILFPPPPGIHTAEPHFLYLHSSILWKVHLPNFQSGKVGDLDLSKFLLAWVFSILCQYNQWHCELCLWRNR